MTAQVQPVASAPKQDRKPKTYVRLTIRPMLAEPDPEKDMQCYVIGAPDSERFTKNLKAFQERWPTSHFLYAQG